MAGMALKGQYNLVSIMVPPGVYERKVFTKKTKNAMFNVKLTVMLHSRFVDG